jgi:hypothetical protein
VGTGQSRNPADEEKWCGGVEAADEEKGASGVDEGR